MSKGKFIIEAYKSYDLSKIYNYNDAVDIILKNKRSKFNETIEICLNLGVDPDMQIKWLGEQLTYQMETEKKLN